jgi:hypothetical protein
MLAKYHPNQFIGLGADPGIKLASGFTTDKYSTHHYKSEE